MGWRSRFVFLLIVYFAGFATAVYCLAPAPESTSISASQKKNLLGATFRSDQFAKSVNTGIYKCIDLGKDAATRAAELIQEKMEEAQRQSKVK
jgi:hypothetical protein